MPLHTEDRDTDLIWHPNNDVKNTQYFAYSSVIVSYLQIFLTSFIFQVRQAIELIARLETLKNERGVTFTFIHLPTQKTATLYTGYKSENNKKEIVTSISVIGKQLKNVLGW